MIRVATAAGAVARLRPGCDLVDQRVTTTANGPGGAGVGVAFGVGLEVVCAEAVGRAEPVWAAPGDDAQPPSAEPAATRQQAVVAALRSIGFLRVAGFADATGPSTRGYVAAGGRSDLTPSDA
ncbi:MAG TPA: hypothetical protein DCX12_13525 [Chloroflexi bacterium]|nr:hypothetical protein [Chloroflexota bacterium]HBV94314.1 hypothetical protein [Chloroflexota bacterium]